MNQEERDWLEWLKRARDGVVTQRHAAEKMGVSDRWLRKLLVRMKTDGDGIVVHGLRGRPSNRRIDEQTQARAIELLKQPEGTTSGRRLPASSWPSDTASTSARRQCVDGW